MIVCFPLLDIESSTSSSFDEQVTAFEMGLLNYTIIVRMILISFFLFQPSSPNWFI